MNVIHCRNGQSYSEPSASGSDNEYNMIHFDVQFVLHVLGGGLLQDLNDLTRAVTILEMLIEDRYDGDLTDKVNGYTNQLSCLICNWSDEQLGAYCSEENMARIMPSLSDL